MKSFLRKRKVRVAAELPEAVKAALETISTNDCKGWFHASEFALIKRIAIDIKVLQMIMGHSDISITMNIYNHVDAARVQNEMKKLENVM